MPKKSLQNKISKKLDQLQKLLDEILEVQVISSDDPDTWDSDALYNLATNLKEALKLLEDQESSKEKRGVYSELSQKDEFGNPLILEAGLCSLVDEYQEEEE